MNLLKKRMAAGRLLTICVMLSGMHPVFSQAPDDSQPKLPNVTLPSPTVAALMKFEEVPVSEYTGIPSVSIPFYSEKVAANLDLAVSLSYHPSGAAVAELAGWAGVGWSLEAGGSISRIMRGNPDDSTAPWAPGIYNSPFDQIYDESQFENGSLTVLNAAENERLLWESINSRGVTRDTNYDIYQFNFMGYSGRFIQTRSGKVIQQQQDSPLQIGLVPGTAVIITDEYGYTYHFAAIEITQTVLNTTTGIYQMAGGTYNSNSFDNLGNPEPVFASSYHLTSISKGNNLLVSFDYATVNEQYDTPKTITNNRLLPTSYPTFPFVSFPQNKKILLLQESKNGKQLLIQTQKLTRITIIGKSRVDFTRVDGRQDYLTDAHGASTGTRLAGITVSDAFGKRTKRFSFDYSYTTFSKRLFLNRIQEYGTDDLGPLAYNFEYDRASSLPDRFSDNVDFWGYYNGASNSTSFPTSPRDGLFGGADKNANPAYVTVGMLKSIQYPTGGKTVLSFESNTSSYQGNRQLEIDEIPENMVPTPITVAGKGNYSYGNPAYPNYSNENPFTYVYIDFDQQVSMNLSIYNDPSTISLQHTENFMYEFLPLKFTVPQTGPFINYDDLVSDASRSTVTVSLSEAGCLDYSCSVPKTFQKGYYAVRLRPKILQVTSMTTINYVLNFSPYKYSPLQRYTNGGGVRIKKIEYTDSYTPAGQSPVTDIIRTKNYDYRNPENGDLSSGSFAFPFPKYYYEQTVNAALMTASSPPDGVTTICPAQYINSDFHYKTYTNYNNHNPLKTKGSDIGYKYVKVSEDQNGWILNTYTSPIDFPEDPWINFTYPFLPGRDLDYKRGLKLSEKVYDKASRILSETAFRYDYLEKFPLTGITAVPSSPGCGYERLFPYYDDYIAYVHGNGVGFCWPHCNAPSTHISFAIDKPVSGWAQLREKQVRNYFYATTASTVGDSIITKENYTYNTLNKRISILDKTDPDGGLLTTKYYYPDDVVSVGTLTGGSLAQSYMDVITLMKNAALHQIALPVQTETYRNGQLLGIQRTLYKNWGSNQIYPEIIQISKGTAALENRIRYNQIDTFRGNPLEVQQENGMKTCYIWGYNKTLPVAKIDNIDYSSIPVSLITAIQSASDAANSETAVLARLSDLRVNAALSGAQLTTYTYFPLMGIGTVTLPSGQKTRFEYDFQKRLKAIWDRDNSQLSQYDYHFRP